MDVYPHTAIFAYSLALFLWFSFWYFFGDQVAERWNKHEARIYWTLVEKLHKRLAAFSHSIKALQGSCKT